MGLVSFERSGSFLVGNTAFDPPFNVEYLVVAGGGGGAGYQGGGGGGYRTGTLDVLTSSNYTVTVGGGGARTTTTAAASTPPGSNGVASVFASISSAGGGGAGQNGGNGSDGGSGGGGGWETSTVAGSGNVPSVSPSQGNDGGLNGAGPNYGGGAGGGAGAVGANGTGAGAGGDGGAGASSSISGTSLFYAGGGGGSFAFSGTAGAGGSSVGGSGSSTTSSDAENGVVNRGGGGGGASWSGSEFNLAGSGGSGVVILRYPTSVVLSTATGLTGTTTTVGQNKVTQITAGTGNISFTATGAEAFPEYPAFLDSAPLWLDASDASTITESGGSVSQWDNKGTLENFTQATSASQPTTGVATINGLNAIQFASDGLLGSTISNWTFLHDGTEYFTAAVLFTPASDFFYIGNELSSSSVGSLFRYGDQAWSRIFRGVSGSFISADVPSGDFDETTPTIYTSLNKPASGTVSERAQVKLNDGTPYVNGTNVGVSTSDAVNNFGIGQTEVSLTNGTVGEIIIVSGADATEANRQTVVNYLNSKWGVF